MPDTLQSREGPARRDWLQLGPSTGSILPLGRRAGTHRAAGTCSSVNDQQSRQRRGACRERWIGQNDPMRVLPWRGPERAWTAPKKLIQSQDGERNCTWMSRCDSGSIAGIRRLASACPSRRRQKLRLELVRRKSSPRPRSARAAHSRAPTRSRCNPCRSRRWRVSCAACT